MSEIAIFTNSRFPISCLEEQRPQTHPAARSKGQMIPSPASQLSLVGIRVS